MLPIDLNHLGLPGAASAFLLDAGDGPILVESGPMSTLQTLCTGLRTHGVDPESIQHVVLTHIHLDHAGAAGWFASHGATVHVHPRGAPHLIDPTKLNESAARVYGERLSSLLGKMHAVPETNVNIVSDRETINASGVKLQALHTPGHASHHYAWAAELDGERTCFTGDIAGMRIPGTDYITLPMAPPEFDPALWHSSIDSLDAVGFDSLVLTHSNRVKDPGAHFAKLRTHLDNEVAMLRTLFADDSLNDDERATRVQVALFDDAVAAGIEPSLAEKHLTLGHANMNVMGIRRMLRRKSSA